MALNTSAIAEAIASELRLAGAEHVYVNYPKISDFEQLLDELQDSGDYLSFWFVRRRSSMPMTSETNRGRVPIGCQVHWIHRFEVGFFIGEREEAQDYLQEMIDDILGHFAAVRTLGELVFGIERPLVLENVVPFEAWNVGGWLATFELAVYDIQEGVTPV